MPGFDDTPANDTLRNSHNSHFISSQISPSVVMSGMASSGGEEILDNCMKLSPCSQLPWEVLHSFIDFLLHLRTHTHTHRHTVPHEHTHTVLARMMCLEKMIKFCFQAI